MNTILFLSLFSLLAGLGYLNLHYNLDTGNQGNVNVTALNTPVFAEILHPDGEVIGIW